MSSPSWRERLRPPPGKIAILGIGSDLRGDDAVGVEAIRHLQNRLQATATPTGSLSPEQRLVIEAGVAPENCTGAIRRFGADFVLMIDAAQMGEPPGTIRYLDLPSATGFDASTHGLPLAMLASYLRAELGCAVALLAVQPASMGLGDPLTPEVRAAAEAVAVALADL